MLLVWIRCVKSGQAVIGFLRVFEKTSGFEQLGKFLRSVIDMCQEEAAKSHRAVNEGGHKATGL